MSELTKQGTEISTAYLVCGGRDKPRQEFLDSGKTVAELVCDSDEDRKDFLKGWNEGWEEGILLLEVLDRDNPSIVECSRLSDRRMLIVERQTFRRARLGVGSLNGWDGGYDDVWDYDSPEAALSALQTWLAEDTVEPQGWIRHYGTGRYRIDGNKSLEWVKDDDRLSLEQNILFAVDTTKRPECLIDSIQENSLHIGDSFPDHSQCFTVASQGVVQWIVYHYCDRSVVLSVEEMESVSVANVIERLKGGKTVTGKELEEL